MDHILWDISYVLLDLNNGGFEIEQITQTKVKDRSTDVNVCVQVERLYLC